MKYLFIIVALFLSSFNSIAQSFNPELDHYCIIVKDVEVSGEFYKNILQLKEVPTPWGDNTPLPAIFFDIGNNRQLHITEYNSEIKLHKFIHFAFTVEDFDGFLELLNEKGIEYGDFSGKKKTFQTRIDEVRQIYFQDPDGYWIEVNDKKHR
jgi:lactoylglutathione lyase